MTTTTTSTLTGHGSPIPDSIVAWDRLEETVDRLADIIDERLTSHDEQLVCSLQPAVSGSGSSRRSPRRRQAYPHRGTADAPVGADRT